MIRKTRVPVKSIPPIVDWILKNSTGQELDLLNSLSGAQTLPILIRLVGKFRNYNIEEVFTYRMMNDHDLALFRAAKKGEVAAFDAFLMAAQAAKSEIKRRKGII